MRWPTRPSSSCAAVPAPPGRSPPDESSSGGRHDLSGHPNSCCTILVMAPGAPQPHLAVKVATTPAAAGVIEREADFLVRLGRLTLPRAGSALPRYAGAFDADGLLAVATSVVPGVPMRAGYHTF